jgi:hypothetical protein
MADLEWKGIALIERAGRPANSPIWDGSDGEPNGVRVLLAANLAEQPPIYSAIVRTEGTPGATGEGPTFRAALALAFAGYATRQNTGPRVRDIQAADRAKLAAAAQQPDAPVGVRGR